MSDHSDGPKGPEEPEEPETPEAGASGGGGSSGNVVNDDGAEEDLPFWQNPAYRFVTAVEVFNGRGSLPENEFSRRVCEELALPATAANDRPTRKRDCTANGTPSATSRRRLADAAPSEP